MLRLLTIALLLLASQGWGAFAAGTMASYQAKDDSLSDYTGTYGILVETGTVPAGTQGVCTGTYRWLSFTTTARFSAPEDLETAMQGSALWTIYAKCVSVNSLAAANEVATMTANDAFEIQAAGNVRLYTGNIGQILTTANTIITVGGGPYDIYWQWDGTTRHIWVYTTSTQVLITHVTDTFAGALPADITNIYIGTYLGVAAVLTGGLGEIRFMNTAPTPPIVDTADAATGPLSPYMMPKQSTGLFVTPIWWRP